MEPRKLATDTVVCFDPGSSTGVALFDEGKLLYCATVPLHEFIEECAVGYSSSFLYKKGFCDLDGIAIEQFSLYADKAQSMIGSHFVPCQVIGAIRVWARTVASELDLTFQSASSAKNFCPDELLDSYEWADKLKTAHERDAARHGVLYLRRSLDQSQSRADNASIDKRYRLRS